MSTSGTWNFTLPTSGLILEAFDRAHIRPPELTRHHLQSARTSVNLELSEWSNIGINLWKVVGGSLSLVTDPITATYTLPSNLVTLTEVYFSQIDGYGPGQNNDRIMVPITRTQYAMIPNKLTPGTPTQYWFEMLDTPQITIWQPPIQGQGAPNYTVSWYGLQQIEDANLGGGENVDVVYRGIEALTAKVALRLFEKFGNMSSPVAWQMLLGRLVKRADDAFYNFQTRDQEMGPTLFQPNVAAYGNIRR